MATLRPGDRVGLVKPSLDAHTLGIDHVVDVLAEVGLHAVVGDATVGEALSDLRNPANVELLRSWLQRHRITHLGVSSRLDPSQAAELVAHLRYSLQLAGYYGGPASQVRALYFAGLPAACDQVRASFGSEIPTFRGDESMGETLAILGVASELIPASMSCQSQYDDALMTFGEQVVASGAPDRVTPENRSGYPEYGTRKDSLLARLSHARRLGQGPLTRSHYGPFHEDRAQGVDAFVAGVRELARGGYLDILSVGTSQLTQARFGQDWGGAPNGGGVPINSAAEYARVYSAAQPMLVRTYAGTQRIAELAAMHEETLNIAWHALSFWWFSSLDGRGTNPVERNLAEHLQTLDVIAATGKPFEPNIAHHFSFRGADDATGILATVLAVKAARLRGVRHVVLQVMLNTPRHTSGVADLAKARALLHVVRRQVGAGVRVTLQPRAGLDFFSADQERARFQLAAVTALMDDIEPDDSTSPGMVHVVSHTEGSHLAGPADIDAHHAGRVDRPSQSSRRRSGAGHGQGARPARAHRRVGRGRVDAAHSNRARRPRPLLCPRTASRPSSRVSGSAAHLG